MKKRLKGLASIWLAAVMVCSMLVTPAWATDEWTVTQPTAENNYTFTASYGSEDVSYQWYKEVTPTEYTLVDTVTDAATQLDADGGIETDTWWKLVGSGGVTYDALPEDNITVELDISEVGGATGGSVSISVSDWFSYKDTEDDDEDGKCSAAASVAAVGMAEIHFYATGDSILSAEALCAQITVTRKYTVAGGTASALVPEGDGTYICVATSQDEYGIPVSIISNEVTYTAPAPDPEPDPEPDPTGVFIGINELGTATYYNYADGTLSAGSENDHNIYMTGSAADGYTLTINGLSVSGAGSVALSSTSADLTLNVEGTNTLTAAGSDTGFSFGIYAAKNLTITGTGSLTANGGTSASASAGIYAAGNITINGSTITATASEAAAHSVGIGTRGVDTRGDITINGGTVTATGGTATSGSSYGIGAAGISGKLTITGGTVNATGGSATIGSSYGIGATGGVSITGGTITARSYDETSAQGSSLLSLARTAFGAEGMGERVTPMASQDAGNNFGIGTNGALSITGGTVNATAGANQDGNSFGIGSDSSISITGGTVITGSGVSSANSVGMLSYGSITLGGDSDVTATGNNAGLASCGIVSGTDVSIGGSATVTATGGNASGPETIPDDPSNTSGNSYGIGAAGQLTISGTANVTATSGDSVSGSCYGVGGVDGVTMNDTATLNATGGEALNGSSHGIGAIGDIYLNDAVTVVATGGRAKSALPDYGSFGIGTRGRVRVHISPNASVTPFGHDLDIGEGYGTATPPIIPVPPVVISPAAHECESVCEVCGGCTDSGCTEEACADKCVLLTLHFADVKRGKWYSEAVTYVAHRGLMGDAGNGLFDLNGTTNRAMLVTILWRLEGEPVVNYAMSFNDVAPNAWYAEAVRWASACGIVGGYSADTFAPMAPITREQMASILWRYAKYKGYDVSVGEDTNILSYTDAFDVNEYAIPAMQWACGAGIINGADGALLPQGDATRAQVATILMRFCESIAD